MASIPNLGRVYWGRHPMFENHRHGHARDRGEGTLLTFAIDGHGQLCGMIELEDGSFEAIRYVELSRAPIDPEEVD